MMWKIYLLGLLSNFQAFFAIAAVIIFVFLIAVGIEFISNECWDDEDDKLGKWLKRGLIAEMLCVMMCMFIPSEKQMYAIIGIGGTLEYLQNNDKAKHLPDKVIDAIDNYLSADNDKK